MYGAGFQAIYEQEVLLGRGYYGVSDPGVWRKREKWKKETRVRWPGTYGLAVVNRCAAVLNEGKTLRKKNLLVRSEFPSTAEAAKSGTWKATGTEANEVCPVPWPDGEGVVEQLPWKVSAGLLLESVGTLYEGPNEDKYWCQNRCGVRHPYPVGYTATKTYKGVQFQQTIEKGPDGPIFVVGEVSKAPCSADSPAKAWSLALAGSPLNSAIRVHGRKHFGFDCPIVLGCLSQMSKEEVVNEGIAQSRNISLESHERKTSNKSHEPQSDKGERLSRALSPRDRVSSAGPYDRSIRLRSVRVEDTFHQRVEILSCQDMNHPVTRGFYEEAISSLSNEDSTMITGTVSANEDFSPSGRSSRTSKSTTLSDNGVVLKEGVSPDTSLDAILRRMDEVARSDGQGSLSKRGEDFSEREMNGGAAEHAVFKQNSSMGQFFGNPLPRARILKESPVPKDPRRAAQTRSLANILEEWNKGGERSQSSRNGKPLNVGGERGGQVLRRPTKVERMPLTREENDDSLSDTTVRSDALDSTDADIQRRLAEWRSGKEGRSLVLKEIQQLVDNRCVDQALQILRTLHSNGARLEDAVYSALFPFTFDDWQKQAVGSARRTSVLVSAPGGAGMFAVAMRCLYQAFVQGERCLIVTPNETLARTHWQQLQILFGGKNVGCVVSKEEDRKSSLPITVITLAILVKELREGRCSSGSSACNSFSEGLSLVVMDRFHSFGDGNYGSLWEEAIMFLDHKVKLLALSLPTKTADDIVTWMTSIHSHCELVSCESEPVQKCQYYCDATGLHLLGNNDGKLLRSNSSGSLHIDGDSVTDFQESIRLSLRSLQTEEFLPLAISFSGIEDCVAATNVAKEVIREDNISADERVCIEERVQQFFRDNAHIEPFVKEDDRKCLSRGFSICHDGQPSSWTDFIEELVNDNLVRIVFGTSAMLCSTSTSFRTIALCLISGKADSRNMSTSSSELLQLCGKVGRRGRDACGNVVFVGGNPTLSREVSAMDLDSASSAHSHFEPSYSLLLNLLSKHTLPEVRCFMDSNYGEFLVKKQFNEELREVELHISAVNERKVDLEAQLFQKLEKLNTTRLQDATTFTHVDVRVATSETFGTDNVLPGVLCAVLPGPSRLLYVILGADNVFRLLPAGALDHVYSDEKPLDAVYESSTGRTIRAPPLPLKERWKTTPGDYLAYTSDGTAESARIVEALLQYGVKVRKADEDEPNCREEIKSYNGLLSTLYQRQETILSRPTATWTKSEKLIESLVRADAVELASNDNACATIKPLGVLISKLHHVENELWFTMALSSSIVKPLTAPELAAICSALLFASSETDSESSNKANIVPNTTPKRLRAALEKLENLRRRVEQLQVSDSPPLRLDGSAVAAVQSLCREPLGQDPDDDLNSSRYHMVLLVQKIINLLHDIDDVWGRSLHVLSALEGTTGLHNLARRAAQLLQKAVVPQR